METLKGQIAVVTGASGGTRKVIALALALVGRLIESSRGLQRFRWPKEGSNRASL